MEKALVVNDCRLERQILKDLISRIGYVVETSDDISSINNIERFRPDILIANQTMDYIQGTDLIRLVKDKYTDTRCYLSSCSLLQPSTLDNDVDGYFQTPITVVELERLLRGNHLLVQSAINPNKIGLTLLNHDKESSAKGIPAKNRFSFCPFCGERLLDSSAPFIFCPFCGGNLS